MLHNRLIAFEAGNAPQQGLPRRLLFACAVILLFATAVFGFRDTEDTRRQLFANMRDRAGVLIWALEGGARSLGGGRHMPQRLLPPAKLIEEMARQPGIAYVAITDSAGVIIAHSSPEQVGRSLHENAPEPPAPSSALQAALVEGESGPVLAVSKLFTPARYYMRGRHPHDRFSEVPNGEEMPKLAVYVGVDATSAMEELDDYIAGTVMLSALVLFAGFCGLFLLYYMQKYRRSKRLLHDAEALATQIGILAAGVAHEIRNPLSTVKGYATYLADKLQNDPKGASTALLMIDEIERLNRVVSDLLRVARPGRLELAPANPCEIVTRSLRLAEAEAEAKHIALRFAQYDSPLRLLADGDRLVQALLNILLNAVQATSEKGTITVEIGDKEAPAGFLSLIVTDTGAGMTQETLNNIFTPYYTTKAQGSGLGLTITRQIVEQHGGSVRVASRPGYGASFTLTLPLAES
ncbi:sensor protein ZraS [Deltaproteobacteria bacterium]|nr:sensor protein ZraS [Deltaproteobacteria bacterium]